MSFERPGEASEFVVPVLIQLDAVVERAGTDHLCAALELLDGAQEHRREVIGEEQHEHEREQDDRRQQPDQRIDRLKSGVARGRQGDSPTRPADVRPREQHVGAVAIDFPGARVQVALHERRHRSPDQLGHRMRRVDALG
jgi:hypothetical protein